CKGVLIACASQYGLDSNEPSYMYLGEERVGGCMRTFSRRDSLRRHLNNCYIGCVGMPACDGIK
ncbi:hypothetical protein C8J57DRAFT_1061617, partial [Mycena rebaudengoi]